MKQIIDGHELEVPAHLMPAEPVKTAHTQTPWRDYGCQILNDEGDIVADVRHAGKVEFIVTACNAYQYLIDALKGIEIIEHGEGDQKEVWFLLRSDGDKIGAGSVRLTGEFALAMSEYTKKRNAALRKPGVSA